MFIFFVVSILIFNIVILIVEEVSNKRWIKSLLEELYVGSIWNDCAKNVSNPYAEFNRVHITEVKEAADGTLWLTFGYIDDKGEPISHCPYHTTFNCFVYTYKYRPEKWLNNANINQAR